MSIPSIAAHASLVRLFALSVSTICALFSSALLASAPSLERLNTLANDPYWLSLGHYEQGQLGAWRSHVDEARFFIAEHGDSSPQAELHATLKALYAPIDHTDNADSHPQCRYPARTRWLREQLQLSDLPAVKCSEFNTWMHDIAPHSTVLVFPAAYLNSPSSMFGHTLLRIDQEHTQTQGSAMLSYALNFGAIIEGSDNSILFAWKGLMGGYPGQFALLPYQQKMAEYNRLENRDLWEYQLNLTAAETQRMLEHVWELKQIRFDYFFFDENCSYRLLELLEVARPGLRLTEQFPLTAIPADTVRAVQEAGLVVSTHYRPSRERELLTSSADFSANEYQWTKALAADAATLNQAEFQALPAARRAAIQDAAYRLLRYQANGNTREQAAAERSYALLQAIQSNPPEPLTISRPELPETGHHSRRIQVAAGSYGDKAFADYQLRMAYHDLQDNQQGFPLGAQIEILKLGLRQYEGNQWQVQHLDLASIRSLTPQTALLKPWSWQVRGGLERVPNNNARHPERTELVGHISGGGGATWAIGEQQLTFAMLTARAEHNPDFASWLEPAMGFNTGLLWRNRLGNLIAQSQADYFLNGEVRRSISLSQHWETSPASGLRLSMSRHFAKTPINELSLGLHWYFY